MEEKIKRPKDYYNNLTEINSQYIINLKKSFTKLTIKKYLEKLTNKNLVKL
jgi:hypothetical protein